MAGHTAGGEFRFKEQSIFRMYKLVILIEPLEDWQAFEDNWPDFLHKVEQMPGLRREAISRVEAFLYGTTPCARMHELFFDTFEAAQQAMASPQGREAGRLLRQMTQGRITLFFAEHKEDELANIRKHQKTAEQPAPAGPGESS